MQTKMVYLSGLDKSEQILFDSYMKLLILRDGSRFDVTEVKDQAQIEIFNPELDASQHDLSASSHCSRIAYLGQGVEASSHHWALHKPARLSKLREVLSSITCDTSILAKSEMALLEHRKLEYWLALLSRFEAEGEAWELKGFRGLRVRLYFKHKQVYLSNEKKWREQLIHTGRALATVIPSDLPAGEHCSMDRFRWQLCEALSGGLLLPGIASRRSFSILQWPDFGVLGASSEQMKLSALFHGRELTIAKAAEISSLPVYSVIDFVNACAVIGLLKDAPTELLNLAAAHPSRKLESKPAEPVTVHRKPGGFSRFLGKLRDKLGLGS